MRQETKIFQEAENYNIPRPLQVTWRGLMYHTLQCMTTTPLRLVTNNIKLPTAIEQCQQEQERQTSPKQTRRSATHLHSHRPGAVVRVVIISGGVSEELEGTGGPLWLGDAGKFTVGLVTYDQPRRQRAGHLSG